MAEPTLQDISSITVDPERATGEPAVVYDQSEMVRNLNQAAQFKAQQDWNKYQFFVKNLQEVYKNIDDVQAMEVMTEDRDYLKAESAKVFSDILKDPRAIYSPELQQKIGKLKSEATESKQNKIFDFAHRQFINQNPELNTDENKLVIDEYRTKPLGQRKAYSLNMPTIFDIEAFKQSTLTHPTVKTQFAESKVTPDNQFIQEVSGNKYDRGKFLEAWNLGLGTKTDKYGHSIKGAADQMFKQLSDADKDYWNKNGGIKGFWNYIGEKSFGGDKDIIEKVKENLQPNPGYLEKQKLNLGWANWGLSKERLNKADNDDLISADSIIKEAAAIISKGEPVVSSNWNNTGKTKRVSEIADPTVLQAFATLDKDGNMVNRPDVVQYDKDSDQLNIIYYEKEKDDYGRITGKIKMSPGGKRIVDRMVPIDSRTWLKQKVKQSYPNKDIGGVNNIVEEVFTNAGGTLTSLTEKVFGTKEENKNATFSVIDPNTGKVILTVKSKEEADKAAAKGYKIK
jgi:hypothetical protein